MFYSGTNGQLFIDGTAAAKVASWSFNSSLGLLDTTTLGDTDATSTPGIRTNSGSCRLYYYSDTGGTGPNDATTLIGKLMTAGSAGVAPEAQQVTLKLAINVGGTAGTKYVQGPAYLTSVQMSCAVGEVLAADCAFQVNGAWTEVAL